MGPYSGCKQQPHRDCLVGSGMFPSRFGDESNKAGGKCNRSIVWLGSSVVECSHGKRETLGSSPGRATFFFRPCDNPNYKFNTYELKTNQVLCRSG